MDFFGMLDGSILQTHEAHDCRGQVCCIHSPSDHALKDAQLLWRTDSRIMERICDHGIGHPDPDHLAHIERACGTIVATIQGIHGCDGCCCG